MRRNISEDEKIIILTASDSILTLIRSLPPINLQEQIVFNIVGNWLTDKAKIKNVELKEVFDKFASEINDEIYCAMSTLEKTNGHSVDIDRKEERFDT